MDLIFLSTIQWDDADGAHTPVQLARELAQRGHSILFLQPFASSRTDSVSSQIKIVALTDLGLSESRVKRALHGLSAGPLEQASENLLSAIARTENAGERRVAVWFASFDPFVRLVC